jgi:recombination DNA repair RAD52 pathway protein
VTAGNRTVIREGIGTGHGIDRDLGQAHESAVKEAETDAMKRALSTFGSQFGLALYDKQQRDVVDAPPANVEPAAPKPQTQPKEAPAPTGASTPAANPPPPTEPEKPAAPTAEHSAKIAGNLKASIENKMTALKKGQRVATVQKAHDEWTSNARKLWLQMTEADRKAVNDKRMELEAMIAERQRRAPPAETPAHDPDTGELMAYEDRQDAA